MKNILKSAIAIAFLLSFASCTQIIHISQRHDCLNCHDSAPGGVRPALKSGINSLCSGCHPERISSGEHRVDVKPRGDAKGLPLSAQGKVTCATCHEPHGLTGHVKLLRMNPAQLCMACHDK